MSAFTDEDRNRLIETHTLLRTHVKKVDDHEQRIRHVERNQSKVIAVFALVTAGLSSAIGSAWHKFFH